VDNHVAEIQQYPVGCLAFGMDDTGTCLFQCLLDFFGDGFELTFAFAAAEDEETGKGTNVPDIEERDIGCLYLTGGFDGFACYIY
jgi:hypothetical protein